MLGTGDKDLVFISYLRYSTIKRNKHSTIWMYLKNSSKRKKLSKEVDDIKDYLLYYSSDMKFLEKAKL